MNAIECRDNIIIPTLETLGLLSSSRVAILLGTCAQESLMGKYRRQLRGGPARGIFEVEPNTHDSVIRWLTKHHPSMLELVLEIRGDDDPLYALENNDCYCCAIAACLYYSIQVPLPEPDDIEGLADYWKDFYNRGGKGTVDEFIANYEKYVEPYLG